MIAILFGVFVATASVIVAGYMYANRRRIDAAIIARDRLRSAPALAETPSILRDMSASALPILDRLLTGRAFTERLDRAIRHAGLVARPGGFLMYAAVSGLVVGLLASLATHGVMVLVWWALGTAAPFWWLRRRIRSRMTQFQTQLPDAIDMLVGAMRAGYSFQSAMKFIGEEMPAPLGPEFDRYSNEQRLGMDAREALLALQSRIDSTDLKMFVTAVLVQRETGGAISEVLGNIADVMRQRADINRQVETLTAESKLSARILAALPIIVVVALQTMDPDFLRPMFEIPIGRLLLAAAGFAVVAGYWMMMSISKVDV